MPPKRDPLSQRRLALELRAAIDIARRRPTSATIDTIETLIRENPHGYRSRHVIHNLGQSRTEWLYENGLLTKP